MAPIGDPFVTNQRCRISSSLSCGAYRAPAANPPASSQALHELIVSAQQPSSICRNNRLRGRPNDRLGIRCRFLGAGAIMKEGANIRGLNTAATVWCSAAVGTSAGVGCAVVARSFRRN
jgi:hypothetical protein